MLPHSKQKSFNFNFFYVSDLPSRVADYGVAWTMVFQDHHLEMPEYLAFIVPVDIWPLDSHLHKTSGR